MILGTVVGSVVSTRKHEKLVGNKLLVVEVTKKQGEAVERLVAIDTVGAGIGEVVMVTTGSNAKHAAHHTESPIDAAIVGIVDDGKVW